MYKQRGERESGGIRRGRNEGQERRPEKEVRKGREGKRKDKSRAVQRTRTWR